MSRPVFNPSPAFFCAADLSLPVNLVNSNQIKSSIQSVSGEQYV